MAGSATRLVHLTVHCKGFTLLSFMIKVQWSIYKCYILPSFFTIKVFMYACLGSCYSCRKGHFPSDGSDKVQKEGVDSTFFLALQQQRRRQL